MTERLVVALTVLFLAGCDHSHVAALDKADWLNYTLPASVCGTSRPVHLRDGEAIIHSLRWPQDRVVAYGHGNPVYGDLTGDGIPEAATQASCGQVNGTAASQLEFSVVIYEATATGRKAIGVLLSQHRGDPNSHLPLTYPISIRKGQVKVGEAFYGPHDGDCCPTGRAVTVWSISHGQFKVRRTYVAHRAKTSTPS